MGRGFESRPPYKWLCRRPPYSDRTRSPPELLDLLHGAAMAESDAPERLTMVVTACDSPVATTTVESLIQEYARRYSAHDAEAVTDLCHGPFVAIRGGRCYPPRGSRRGAQSLRDDHWTRTVLRGAAVWSPIEIETHHLGEHAAFATVRWHTHDSEGTVVRDTETTYHVLAGPAGWRFLSYTNHL